MTETRQFDWTGENTVTFAVVETVSAVTGQAVTEMQPLAQVIDAGALNTIFADGQTAEQSHFQIQFEYEDCLIRVTAGGEITATALHRF
jgi:hypothetical protein